MTPEKKLLELLKAYFTENFLGASDYTADDGCPTCGGGTEVMSLERIRDTIDAFYIKHVKGGDSMKKTKSII
jgi:hypothetical protein